MILPKSSGNYFNGFSELRNYNCNSGITTLCAVIKIVTYCTIVLPASVYILSSICDRFTYPQELSQQAKKVDSHVKESNYNRKEAYSSQPSPYFCASNLVPAGYAPKPKVEGTACMQIDTLGSTEPKTLYKNGAGIRKVFAGCVEVYNASLWVEKPSQDANKLISTDAPKSIKLEMLRNVPGDKISGAIVEGFKSNSSSQMDELSERLLKMKFPTMDQGDVVQMTYLPGKGTTVSVRGDVKETIEGKDFADALFSVWLGEKPVQTDLKTALLGK
jgi:hypothetical protein